MEGVEIITKPNPVLPIANTVDTEFGFIPLM